MSNTNQQDKKPEDFNKESSTSQSSAQSSSSLDTAAGQPPQAVQQSPESNVHPIDRNSPSRGGARGTAAMDPDTRKEVARKGGVAVSKNRQHMAEIGRKGGQSVSKNRDHMASIGRKGGAASRGSTKPGDSGQGNSGEGQSQT